MSMLPEPYMKECGREDIDMDLALNNGLMAQGMLESGEKVRHVALASSSTLMVTSIKVSGPMTKLTALASMFI